ncbi:leucine-rich repeat protein soc-2 homolog isoform X2 [Wyeomyia smithii]|uniref:leucine-rich repeat protein soc-2 homolog isoform X2 n=1 Tax=Wyeomyia smithii TaxID=174621 RepID=UPI002467C13C|nr:leucine-rich repeat protein soc-2 homolog isoform X2 [Wyeomyia smithii]
MNCEILHWSYRDFRLIPEELRSFGAQVLEVYLKENFIPSIPQWFFEQMTHLRFLSLAGNLLVDIPEQISLLIHLEVLDLSQNSISLLPNTIGCLHNLTTLRINENKLTHLPQEIEKLNKLEILDASNNCLLEIPIELGLCKTLREITLNDNYHLIRIPTKIFTMPPLVFLSAERCNLLSLPFAANSTSLEIVRVFKNHSLTHYPLVLEKFMQPNYDILNAVELKRLTISRTSELTTVLDRRRSGQIPNSLNEICLRSCNGYAKINCSLCLLRPFLPADMWLRLRQGPVAICGSPPCSKTIFSECFLGLVKRRNHARPVGFTILFCSKLCADLWFQYNCDVYEELYWVAI